MKGVVIEQKAFEKLLSKINLLTDAINFINQTIQKEELESAKWVTKDELIKMCNQGIFDKNAYFDEVVNGEYDEVRK